ncbi:MAG: hypothetical protein AAF682_24305 [Planctomycetota bacterium]
MVQIELFEPEGIAAGAPSLEGSLKVRASESAKLTYSFDEFELTADLENAPRWAP